MINGKKRAQETAAANDLAGRILVTDMVLSTFLGIEFAALPPTGAEAMKAEIGQCIDILAAACPPDLRSAIVKAAHVLQDLIDTAEKNARERVAAAQRVATP